MNSKTPVSVLQELMTKLMDVPSYECISQNGPQHMAVFEYRCVARNVTAHGVARSKKEAKQEAARRALAALSAKGLPVPPPYCVAPGAVPPEVRELESPKASASREGGDAEAGSSSGPMGSRSYVALLKELCEEFRLGAVVYELVGDTGPPHLRMFTVRAVLGSHERIATATTKKVARQMAAQQLYTYLRENLAHATKDFVEMRESDLQIGKSVPEPAEKKDSAQERRNKRKSTEVSEEVPIKRSCDVDTSEEAIVKISEEALNRALDKVMARYVDIREEQPWRPDLGQRIADYHLDAEQRLAAEAALIKTEEPVAALQATAAALGMVVELSTLPAERGAVSVVSLGHTAPALALAGATPEAATGAALRYLRRAIRARSGEPAPASW